MTPESDLPVPSSEAEVTQEWLQAILADPFPDATFASLERERIGEAYGFASRIFRLQWQDMEKLQSVVVKLWDTDGKAGIKEVLFYQTFPEVGTRIPAVYYSAVDEKTKKAVLVLEDLKDAIQGDVLEQLDLERAIGVAHSLAKLHATWLENPSLARLPWLSDVSTWARKREWFLSRRDLFLERFPDHLDGLARLLLDKLELAPEVANERMANAPVTLLHGDFHLDNFLFEKQGEPVLLDWSRPARGPQAVNLADLLFVMTPLQYFDSVFESYLEAFDRLAETTLKGADLEKQLGGMLLRKFELSTCGGALWQPSLPRAVEMIDVSIERARRAVEFWQGRDPDLFSFLS